MVSDAVAQAILDTPADELCREMASGLVEAYVERFASDAQRFKVLDVERPWHLWISEETVLVGCKDTQFEDETGRLLQELKTHKAPRRTKAGEVYKGEGEQDWLSKISNGPQLGIYALHEAETTGAEYVRIMVRAAVKESPVSFWPKNEADGVFILNRPYLEFLRNALLVKASQVRAARLSGVVPWDWMGYKCGRMYGQECHFFKQCSEHRHPEGWGSAFHEDDPGSAGIKGALAERGWGPERLEDPRIVILSASAYESYSVCFERGRLIQGQLGPGEDNANLQVGSAFHNAIACWYREMQDAQR